MVLVMVCAIKNTYNMMHSPIMSIHSWFVAATVKECFCNEPTDTYVTYSQLTECPHTDARV